MYKRLGRSEGRVIAFELSSEVTEEDIEEMNLAVDEAVTKFGKMRVLFELVNLKVDSPSGYWDTFKVAREHGDTIERVAIVGDNSWERRWTRIGGLLVKSDVKYFDEAQLKAAWDWIRE